MAGLNELTVPFAGTVLRVEVAPGDRVPAGAVLVVLESMKMEHVVEAPEAGRIEAVAVSVGDSVQTGDVLLRIDQAVDGTGTEKHRAEAEPPAAVTGVRPELAELRTRVAATLDPGRPAATERRHAAGRPGPVPVGRLVHTHQDVAGLH